MRQKKTAKRQEREGKNERKREKGSSPYHPYVKNVQIKIKNVTKRKNVTKIKKTFVNVIKNVTS